jgi:hypothetical protein
MRFLTVEELVARKECNTWSKEWIRRSTVLNFSSRSTINIDELLTMYNEGTLLLYRMGFPDLAQRACGRALHLRRSSRVRGFTTFAIQQWINLSRLDMAAHCPARCDRRLRYLEAALQRLTEHLSPEDVRKTRTICFVERTALLLSQMDLHAMCSLNQTVSSSIASEVHGCMIEGKIRCMTKMGYLGQALGLVSSSLLAVDDERILGPLMVLLATLRPLTCDEADLLLRMMSNRLAERPIHYVQVGEFLLRNSRPENRIRLAALIEPLLVFSIQVGDIVSSRFLVELCGQPEQSRDFVIPLLRSSSILPSAASVIAEQLDLLLSQICDYGSSHG